MCKHEMYRDWQTDAPTIDTSSCRDHNFIPREKRVYKNGTRSGADKLERAYAENVKRERALLKDGNKGSIKKKMAVPAELYHGKCRETGDKYYWKDPKNVSRHNAFRVDGG